MYRATWTAVRLVLLRWALYMIDASSAMGRLLEDMQEEVDEIAKSCYFTENERICTHCSEDNQFCMSEVCPTDDDSATELECSVCASKVDEYGYAVYMDFCLDLYCDANTVFGGNGTMACSCRRAKVYGIACDSCSFCDGGFSFETVASARHIGVGLSLSCSAYEDTDATTSCGSIDAIQTSHKLRTGAIILTGVAVAFILFMGVSYRRRRSGKQHRLSRSEIQAALNLENERVVT